MSCTQRRPRQRQQQLRCYGYVMPCLAMQLSHGQWTGGKTTPPSPAVQIMHAALPVPAPKRSLARSTDDIQTPVRRKQEAAVNFPSPPIPAPKDPERHAMPCRSFILGYNSSSVSAFGKSMMDGIRSRTIGVGWSKFRVRGSHSARVSIRGVG